MKLFVTSVNGLDSQDNGQATAVRRQAQSLGLRLTAHCVDNLCLAARDNGAVAHCRRFLSGLQHYGVESMVMHVEGSATTAGEASSDRMAALVDALADLAPTCETTGIPLLVETMTPGRLTADIDRIIAAVDAVGSPWVGICIDTNHVNLSIDVAVAIGKARHRVREFHANDNHGQREEHLVPYGGIIDWTAFARAVREIGFVGPIVLEPSPMPGESPECVFEKAQRAADRLRRDLSSSSR